jgi:DNA polymerase I-like protein with 3'-5' exonuclease and polymerase domains
LTIRDADYSRDQKTWRAVFTDPPPQLAPAEVFSALKPLLFGDALKVGHNLKFDLESVTKYLGEVPAPPYACTYVASFLADNRNRHALGLAACLKREFNYEMEKGVGKEVEAYDFRTVANYALLDAHWTWKLWRKLEGRISESNLEKVFRMEMDVLEVLCSMELTGAVIDTDSLYLLRETLEEGVEAAKGRIYKAAGRAFNINSNADKTALLFSPKKEGGLGLRARKMTPGGAPSVAADALEALRGSHEVVDGLLEYSEINKLLSTYVIPYLGGDVTRSVNGKEKVVAKASLLTDGVIHADFDQCGAETGRFSSRRPNLQNVPAPHTEHGRSIRNLFAAPEGHRLVVADYSQIEPRVIASLSGDPVMTSNYLDGGDIYTTVGDVMGVDRKAGKVLVLSMAYGVGPEKIASQIGCTPAEARELLEDFTRQFRSVAQYKRSVISKARKRRPVPFVTTLFGRRRYLPNLNSDEKGFRAQAERQTFNTAIQGSAADIIKLAMIRTHQMLPEDSSLVLTVHDELVVMTPERSAQDAANIVREAMEGINVLNVPLLADVKIVNKWGEAK